MIDPALDRRFPDAAAMEAAGVPRIPRFVRDYMVGGIGAEVGLARNRSALDAVALMPRYVVECAVPDLSVTVAGVRWAAPFAVAPMGLGGLIWPGAELAIARAMGAAGLGHVLSTVSTTAMEQIALLAGAGRIFQLYSFADPKIDAALMARAWAAGYEVLMVTVDVPGATRRRRDIQSGLSFPPRFTLQSLLQIMACPRWAMGQAGRGIPAFQNILPVLPKGSVTEQAAFIGAQLEGHIGPARLARIRAVWPGRLIVKGVLSPEDAAVALDCGADGVVVSNHGGRQLDAAPASVEVLPAIRDRLGEGALVLADSGVRSGLDIARMLARGADAVLIGRPFLQAAAAAGPRGPAHLAAVLMAELRTTMGQLGMSRLDDLRGAEWSL